MWGMGGNISEHDVHSIMLQLLNAEAGVCLFCFLCILKLLYILLPPHRVV